MPKGQSYPHPVLTDAERLEVCKEIAGFKDDDAIVQTVKDRFGKTISADAIESYRHSKKWQPLIDGARHQWIASVVNFPFAHKRGRIEELSRLYARCSTMPSWKEWARMNMQLSILSHIREEMDEQKTNFNSITVNQFHSYSDEELTRRQDELVAKLQTYRRRHGTLGDGRTELTPAGSHDPKDDGGIGQVGYDQDDGSTQSQTAG